MKYTLNKQINSFVWELKLICIIHQFLAAPFPLTGKMEENITWAAALFTWSPRAFYSSLILPGFWLALSFLPGAKNSSGEQSVTMVMCDTLSASPQPQLPKDNTSQPHQGGTWAFQCPLTESCTASTPCFFLLYSLNRCWYSLSLQSLFVVFVAVKASDVALVVILDGKDWRIVLIL